MKIERTVRLELPVHGRPVGLTVASAVSTKYGPIPDFVSHEMISSGEIYEKQVVENLADEIDRFVGPDHTFVDVGANLGTYSAVAEAFGSHAIAIEPQPLLQGILKENVKGEVHAVGCSDREGELEIWETHMRHPDKNAIMANLGGHSLQETTGRTKSETKVPVKTLDSVLGGRQAHVIKVDVEGMEEQVLEGARETLKLWKPILYLEQNDAHQLARVFEFLNEFGYEPVRMFHDDYTVVVKYA
jgi:FkbM family methyltransferase